MNLQLIKEQNIADNWDDELQALNGSVFLSSAWLENVASENRKPAYFRFVKNSQTRALLAGFERPFGRTAEKQLFFYSGPVGANLGKEEVQEIKKLLLDYARSKSYHRLIIKSYDSDSFVPVSMEGFKEFKRAECIIDLGVSKDVLIKGFTKNVRRNVKNARKKGVEFYVGRETKLLDKLISLTEETLRLRVDKGYKAYRIFTMPFLEKEEMYRLLRAGAATLFYGVYEGEVVSVQFAVTAMGRAYGIFMGNSEKAYELAAPSLVFYESAMYLFKQGYVTYNLGGVPLGGEHDGVRKFKMDMGAVLVESSEETTAFLLPSSKKLNPVLSFKDSISSSPLPWRVKKMSFTVLDKVLKGREHY